MRKYIIWTPPFMANIGGITVLHKFCDMLNRLGKNAYLWPADNNFHTFLTNGKYISPLASRDMIDDDAIVIYPEIVIDNPLNAKNVVRWILNIPGNQGGDGIFGENDLLFYYSKHFSEGKKDLNYLMIVESYGDLFQNYHLPFRKGNCYTMRKGAGRELIHDTSDSIEISDSTPSENLVELFNERERFYSYDDATFLSFQAALCGCISIVVPTDRFTLEEYYNSSPFHKNGIAYGEDEIEHAVKTMKNVRPFLEEFELKSYKQLEQFILKTEQYFIKKNLFNKKTKNSSLFSEEKFLEKAVTDNEILYLMIKKAERLINHNQIDEADELLKRLLNVHPTNLDVLNDIAIINIFKENNTEAIIFLKTVLELDPTNEIALENFQYLSENIE